MELSLRVGRVWWTGFKVLCRWGAFGLVLCMLWLPLAGLMYLLGGAAGGSLGTVLLLLVAPFPFYFTSRYLGLLGDGNPPAREAEGGPPDAAAREAYPLKNKIVISMGAAFFAGYLLSPPDAISQLCLGIAMAFLCGVPLSILARLPFMKFAPRPTQTLVCVLVCLTAVLATWCLFFLPGILGR